MSKSSDRVIVIGAGIVGVASAIWLQRSGFKVTIIDREGVAAGTSFGNAGVLASSAIVPVTVPGLLAKAPAMLFSKDQPLFLNWSYLPKLAPFLWRYLAHANHRDVEWISAALSDLMHDSADQHFALAKGTAAEVYLKSTDYVYLYDDEKEYQKDALSWKIRRQNNFQDEELNALALSEYDPALAGKFDFAVRALNQGQITDPGEYTKALAKHFEDQGGEIKIATVQDIVIEHGKAKAVSTDKGNFEADQVVIAAGAWSAPLAQKLGVKVPLESERGYHLEFVNSNMQLRSPVMVSSGKFAMNSMDGRLRCAGIVEFGGLDAGPSQAPFDLLKRQMKKSFPELKYDGVNQWMGHRPCTPDSLPLIGAFENVPNVWAGFGHQHLGLTGAAKTGRLLSQMIAGETPNIDMKLFAADRF